MGAQLAGGLIDGEAGSIGGDLIQHAAWLPEVHRVEVLSIHHGSYAQTLGLDCRTSLQLLGIGSGAERHVMDRTHSTGAAPEPGRAPQVDYGSQPGARCLIAPESSGLPGRIEPQGVG